jgi:hypothetical protein
MGASPTQVAGSTFLGGNLGEQKWRKIFLIIREVHRIAPAKTRMGGLIQMIVQKTFIGREGDFSIDLKKFSPMK